MWSIEARGNDDQYFYRAGLTERAANSRLFKMADSGEWKAVRAWDTVQEQKQKESDERIRNWNKNA